MMARAKAGLRATAISQSSRLLPKNGSLAQNALLMLRGFGLRIRN